MPTPTSQQRRNRAIRADARQVAPHTAYGAEYVRPWLYPKQFDAIFTPKRYGIIEASTKSGKTWGCIIWLFEQAASTGVRGRNYWWVAPIYPQARIAFKRFRDALIAEPPADPRALIDLCAINESRMEITLPNGATLSFKSGDNADGLYGEDVYAVVMDEATRMKEDAFIAIRTTMTATRGPIRIIGNVKGKKNWVYRMARRAEAGEAEMHFARLTAFDAVQAMKPDGTSVLSAEEIEDARRNLPAAAFAELYLAEAGDDGSNPFGIEAIRQCVAPLSTEPAVCWGVDLAKSIDWTVAIGLDAAGAVCRFERWQAPWKTTIRLVVAMIGPQPALVDSTGVGDPVLEEMQSYGGEVRTNFEGFHFHASSKQQLMEGLALDIQSGKTTFPDGVLRQELEDFEYVYTRTGVRYSAPEGMHDDCVCAYALARQRFRTTDFTPARVW